MRKITVDELDYYFLYGPTFDGVVDRYRRLTGAAPMLDRMPLYVRAGSIVPMAPRIQHSGELAGSSSAAGPAKRKPRRSSAGKGAP